MKKKNFVALILLSFFIMCRKEFRPIEKNVPGASIENAGSTHPNIILIVADDVGYSLLSCDGGQLYQTPKLDNMAATGRRFTECHASGPA